MTAQWRKIGQVGVDSGTLMIGDPCYFIGKEKSEQVSDGDWIKFCETTMMNPDHTIRHTGDIANGTGVFASTMYGDGSYNVYGLFDTSARGSVRPLAMLVITADDSDMPTYVPELPRDQEEEDDEK